MSHQAYRRFLRRFLDAFGVEVRRRQATAQPSGYYPTQPSCQVPDVGFLFEQFLGKRERGSFVEVGAYDGVSFSNTWGLAARGWHGLMIEPIPQFAAACAEAHAGHPNVRVANVAIGSGDRPTKELRRAGSLTTDSQTQVDEYRELGWLAEPAAETVEVPSVRLDALLADSGIQPGFDVLVVDVEGQEGEVFASFDLARWRPGMLIVELADTHPELTLRRSADFALHGRLLAAGYWTAYKDRINTVLVRRDLADAAYT